MKFACYFLLIALLGCHANNEPTIGPERTELAFINDTSQFADGRDLFIQLDPGNSSNPATNYKPTPATLPIAQQAITELAVNPKDPVRVPVKIRFLETTNQVVIHCGWSNSTVTEIRILDISKR